MGHYSVLPTLYLWYHWVPSNLLGETMGIASKTRSVGEPLSSESEGTGLPREEIFNVLSNERRQCILHYLQRHRGHQVELRELVDYVAAWENDVSPDALESDDRKRVYTALRQSHLPKLDDAGIIEYEHVRGEVTLTEEARRVQMYLEYVPRTGVRWAEYYLLLSGVGTLLVAATWAGVAPFGGLGDVGLAAILVGLLVVSGTVHRYHSNRGKHGAEKFEV